MLEKAHDTGLSFLSWFVAWDMVFLYVEMIEVRKNVAKTMNLLFNTEVVILPAQ
jgi:hypothetical protein